jgi:hypothetical protein
VLRGGCVVHIDPENFAEQRGSVLPICIGIVCTPPVPYADVQISVGAKRNHPAIMVGEGLIDLDDFELAQRVGPVRIARQNPETRYDRPERIGSSVVDVEVPVGRILRMECKSQESLFTRYGAQFRREAQERLRGGHRRVVREHQYVPVLLNDEDPVRAVTGVREEDRDIEGKGGKGFHQ